MVAAQADLTAATAHREGNRLQGDSRFLKRTSPPSNPAGNDASLLLKPSSISPPPPFQPWTSPAEARPTVQPLPTPPSLRPPSPSMTSKQSSLPSTTEGHVLTNPRDRQQGRRGSCSSRPDRCDCSPRRKPPARRQSLSQVNLATTEAEHAVAAATGLLSACPACLPYPALSVVTKAGVFRHHSLAQNFSIRQLLILAHIDFETHF